MIDNVLKQELSEILADLKDLATALDRATPIRSRQLLQLTSSVERHFEHLLRCSAGAIPTLAQNHEVKAEDRVQQTRARLMLQGVGTLATGNSTSERCDTAATLPRRGRARTV